MNATQLATERPVTLNMKVSDVLKEHPELLDVLVAQSPHFSRLKNPILRRIQARLVTVGQAATMAGLDPVSLVRTLNAAIGQASSEEASIVPFSMAGSPEPPWVKMTPITVKLDVREEQKRNGDVFQSIMLAARQVKEGGVFYLRNTFEPLPLYDQLANQGFIPWARNLGPEDWEIYFLKIGGGKKSAEAEEQYPSPLIESETSAEDLDTLTPAVEITIEESDLTPPKPMLKILDALEKLKPGDILLVHHVHRPVHLYPKLAELGYRQKTIERGPGQIDVYIHKG